MPSSIYHTLIVGERLGSHQMHRSLSEELTSDKTRIVFSSPFRRLQQKAQVFSLETNAAIRSRLTHTLEVATIGISIAEEITKKLLFNSLIEAELTLPFIKIVETACLSHDLGNPPFGHFAEEAIKKWFTANWEKIFSKASHIDKKAINSLQNISNLITDFLYFDGNPQAVRIITTLQDIKLPNNENEFTDFGMNMTVSQIAAIIKYIPNPSNIDKNNPLTKKSGYFHSEENKILSVRQKLNLKGRYPLTYIMEAADDISYCISDIEDGIEKKILTSRYFFEKLLEEYSLTFSSSGVKYKDLIFQKKSKEDFYRFKIEIIRDIENFASENYIIKHKEILNGTLPELIEKESDQGKILQCLKNVSKKYLFRSEEAENKELVGYHAIYGVLDKYKLLLLLDHEKFNHLIKAKQDINKVLQSKLDIEWRLFNRLPEKYVDAYIFKYENIRKQYGESSEELKEFEWFYRAHLIVDYISGMTDNYVLETYNLLYGIKI